PERSETHDKKSACMHAVSPSLGIQQEVTEETEDQVRLCSLRCLLFKPIRVTPRRTPELSHAGPMTVDNPRLPGKPGAFPGVGSSDLVRQNHFWNMSR